MAGNVTGLHVFTADVGPEALSLLDNNFNPLITALNTLANFSNYYVDSGIANVLAVTTIGSQVFSYVDGMLLEVKVAITSTSGAPTLNVNALGAKTITDNNGNQLIPGAMKSGGRYFLIYDGANFRLLNPFVAVAQTIAKTAVTSRTTTTASNDPELQVSILAAGSYLIEGVVYAWGTTTTTQGIQANLNYSGTFTAASSPWATSNTSISASPTTGLLGFANLTSGAAPGAGQFALTAGLTPTGAGTLAFSWAQNSASANATNVGINSWIRVTRLA